MTRDPILVVGVTQRSGTNFLFELLRLHPDTAAPRRILEDHLPRGASQVADGLRAIVDKYPSDWLARHEAESMLLHRVGGAMVDVLAADAGLGPDDSRRLLTKTPGAAGVRDLVELVPDASVLLLVRDGRDLVASGMRGLGWSFTHGVDQWLDGARAVLSLVGRPLPLGVRARVVRFEDLVADPVAEVTEMLTWLGLDPSRWDPDAAQALPVYGSSFHTGDADGVHWDPVEPPEGFDPRGRAAGWSEEQHVRFLVRAATELRALGYPVDVPALSGPAVRGIGRELLRGAKRAAGWLVRG